MILHICFENDWKTAVSAGKYTADSLTTEGFIHCSTPQQLLRTANGLFHGQAGLLLLAINPDSVSAPIVYEDCYETGQEFPHIYGPLNLDAVTAVINFPPQADGRFGLPDELV